MRSGSSATIVFVLVVFIALVVVLQFNVSFVLTGFETSSNADSLRASVAELQSELKAAEARRSRLQVQMDGLLNAENESINKEEDDNISSHKQQDEKGAIAQSIALLQKELKDLQESKNMLELRVNSWMNWMSDPYLGSNTNPSLCKNATSLEEFGCTNKGKGGCPGLYDHQICLDDFPPKDGRECIIYDFGIREQPEFGQTLLNAPFHCKIFAFDPSPITDKWYKHSPLAKHLSDNENYTLFHYGAGGKDGKVKLNEYDWGQVSIIRFPLEIQKNCSNSKNPGKDCQMDRYAYNRKNFELPVRTLDSIMKELGHDHIDILKVDVEGSEYMFLEHALEHGNLEMVDQLTVEWHHYDFDSRYGGGSAPAINTIVALLNKIGFQQFYIHDFIGGWPGTPKEFWDRSITLRYNLASFLKVKD